MRYDLTLLKRERLALGWHLTRLSEKSGVTIRTIQRLEKHPRANPHATTVKKLADAMGLSLRELIVEDDAA